MNKVIKKLFSPFCVFISLLLLTYVYYKSEFIWQGARREYYFSYYIISFSILIFSIFTFFLSEKIKIYLSIIFFSTFLTFYLFEIYLIFSDSTFHKAKIYKKETGKIFDKRSKLEIYNDLKKIEKEITITSFPFEYLNKSNMNFLPLSGKSNSKTIFCNENGYYSIYQSDRYGFNNPDKEWDKKEVEYLLIGDSFVHGACVNRPNDISSKLRKISKKSAISLGYGSNGPILEYASLREFFPNKVKNVLWFYYEGNDVKDLSDELGNNFLKKYLKDINFSQNLKKKQDLVDNLSIEIIDFEKKKAEQNLKKSLNQKKIYSFLKLKNLRSRLNILLPSKRRPPTQNQIRPEFREILKLAKELTEKEGSNFYFVYLPTYKRYKKIDNNDKNYNKIKSITNELKIPFIDIHKKVFEKEKNPLKLFPFEMYAHYTIEGNEKIAQTIYKFIKNRN